MFHASRALACIALTLMGGLAAAHHGWSTFDEAKPLYIEGTVASVRWQNPHAELTVEVPVSLALPKDLASRPFPKQVSTAVTPAMVSGSATPAMPAGKWTVELAPLPRMEAWGLSTPIKVGDKVSMIGFSRAGAKDKVMRVEILYTADGKAYGLRSAPAQ
jgi:Family of unknown function (DUF6152)